MFSTKYKIERHSAQTSTDDEAVCTMSDFPKNDSDFSDDLTVLPTFNPGDLYNLVRHSGKSVHKYRNVPAVDKPIDKGFFMKNLVHDLQTCRRDSYYCIRKMTTIAIRATYYIFILETPKVKVNCSSPKTMNESNYFACECQGIDGNPRANVTWYKGNEIVATGKEKAVFTFPSVSKDDNGTYRCEAKSHKKAKNETSIHIIVQCKYILALNYWSNVK